MLAFRYLFAQNPAAVVAQKAQPSGGLVKIWPGDNARPFFFPSHLSHSMMEALLASSSDLNPAAVVAQKAQPSGGLVKIWPGDNARPFFFPSHLSHSMMEALLASS